MYIPLLKVQEELFTSSLKLLCQQSQLLQQLLSVIFQEVKILLMAMHLHLLRLWTQACKIFSIMEIQQRVLY